MKTIPLILLLIVSGAALAQPLPNAGFESWVECLVASDPIPFQTSNSYSFLLSGSPNVEQTTNSHGGSFAAYIHADATLQIPGILSLGQDISGSEITPLPFSGIPDSLGFWAQHIIDELDVAVVFITLYEGLNEVGFGIITINGTSTGYAYYSVPIDIETGANPDGMSLIISSGEDPSLGGELTIDDLHLIYNTGSGDDIPGGDFESWNMTSIQCLDNWTTTNTFTMPNVSVDQGEPHSGNYSARITNQPNNIGEGAVGFIILGNPNEEFCSDESLIMAQGQVVTTINGFYKYTAGNPNEMATTYLYYSTTNDIGDCDSTYEQYNYWPAVTDWTPFTIVVPNTIVAEWIANQQAPDYLSIGFVSTMVSNESEPNGDPGSVLLVDDINVEYTTVDVNEMHGLNSFVFPNPVKDELNVHLPHTMEIHVQLFDMQGQCVKNLDTRGTMVKISTTELSSGMYTVTITDGNASSSHRIMVQH